MQCWNFNQPTERYLYRINRKNLITVFPVVSIKKEFIFFLNASFQLTKSVGGVPTYPSLMGICGVALRHVTVTIGLYSVRLYGWERPSNYPCEI